MVVASVLGSLSWGMSVFGQPKMATLGNGPHRNMVNLSAEGLPTRWRVKNNPLNIEWVAQLGSTTYGEPVVADGKVFVSTNNKKPRDPNVRGPKSILMCFDQNTGKYLWQIVNEMPPKNIVREALHDGSCGTPTVVGKRIYFLAPAAELVCARTSDGKILWSLDMMKVIFAGGDCYLYGLDARTGKMIWKFYCNSKAEANRQKQRGFPTYILSTPVIYKNRAYIGIGLYPGHFASNKIGHFWCIDITKKGDVSPKEDNFDPKAKVNKNSALVWHFGGEVKPRPKAGQRSVYFGKTLSTAAIYDGLVYISEELGYVHCLDSETGKLYWSYDAFSGIWGSPMWVDDRVYVGTEQGDILVFQHGKKLNLIRTNYMGGNLFGTPVAEGSTLYVTTRSKLYAIGE